jgi:nucleoside 2-deoxyribosyltransferase
MDLMNIYISHSSSYDYENELYKPIKESKLSSLHHFFLPHEPENIDVDAVTEFKQTDILVAEVSYPSTGQGIELGQASLANIPTVCFYKVGTKPSSSLRFVTDNIIEYSDIHDLLVKLEIELQ